MDHGKFIERHCPRLLRDIEEAGSAGVPPALPETKTKTMACAICCGPVTVDDLPYVCVLCPGCRRFEPVFMSGFAHGRAYQAKQVPRPRRTRDWGLLRASLFAAGGFLLGLAVLIGVLHAL